MAAPLLITGASARAAAYSAVRAGFTPVAADMFADDDLRACCETVRIEAYPRQMVEAARRLPPGPWMYTGAIENQPALVDQLAAERVLLGNAGDVLRRVRNPRLIGDTLVAAGCRYPATLASSAAVAHSAANGTRWLRKPRDSSAGHGISFADSADSAAEGRESEFWQEYIAGESASAVFVAAAGRAMLLGVTRQLIGTSWTGATRFGYAGSIGPWPVSETVRNALRKIGDVLAERFGLAGLFGVDFQLVGDEVWTIEVNPRYTASIEVLERTGPLRSIALHVEACEANRLPTEPSFAAETFAGKAIVYAREALVIGERFAQLVPRFNRDAAWPQIADLPAVGSAIAAGWPICTVQATGANANEVETRLRALAGEVTGDQTVD